MTCSRTGLETAGQAAFFTAILSIMLPPYMAFSVFVFAILTLVVGMCLGWAWGVAGMAAALRARSVTLLASQYTRAQSRISPSGASPDSQCKPSWASMRFADLCRASP